MSYAFLKHLHIFCAVLSISGFILRSAWMLYSPAKLRRRWVRILPHIIDTLLLLSAVGLTLKVQQYPFADNWLTIKVLALVVYIFLGFYALKSRAAKGKKALAAVAAILVFAFIVWTAIHKNPYFFSGLL